MDSIILVLHIIVSVLLIGLILIQHGKGADAGAAALGGASSSVFGSQGSASFLSRSSAILATIFFLTSLSLAYFSGKAEPKKSSVTEISVPSQQSGVTNEKPVPADLPE